MILRFAATLLALGLVAEPAMAQQQDCELSGSIVSLSDIVLAHRSALPRLQARSYGAEAAYLKIKYAPLGETEAAAFLTNLLDDDIRELRDVALAWFVTTHGLNAASEALGGEVMEAAILASPTTVRALILADADDVVLNALAALPVTERSGPLQRVYAAIIDQPDALKARVAAEAEERELTEVAAALHASQQDTTAWTTFIARVADPTAAADYARMFEFVPIFVGNPPLPGVQHNDPDTWSKIHEIMAAAVLQPEVEYLNTFLNYTGLYQETHTVAAALEGKIGVHLLPPKGPFDPGWLFTYQGLKSVAENDAMVDDMLRNMSVGGRFLRPTSADVMDWIIAADALLLYAGKFASDLPAVPEGPTGTLADSFDEWIAVAQLVRDRASPEAFTGDERRLAMAAELMFATSSRYVSLTQMLEAAPPSRASVALAADFAKRYDRLCAAYLWHPAESVLLAGTPIYKFDGPVTEEAETPPTDKLKN